MPSLSSTDPVARLHSLLEELTSAVTDLIRDSAQPKEAVTVQAAPNNQKKLSRHEADHIRHLKRLGFRQADIARAYDVNPATISRIVRGVYYR